jgi:hypothetical protein
MAAASRARRVVELLTAIAQKAGSSILLVRLGSRRNPGSGSLLASARSVLRIVRAPSPEHPNERLLLSLKQTFAPDQPVMRFHITTPDALIQQHAWQHALPDSVLGDCRP